MSRIHVDRRDEAGFSLMELVVAVLVLGIVSVVLFDFLDNTTQVTARGTATVVKENEGRLALREITEDVRGSYTIASTYPTNAACTSGGTYPAGYGNCLSFEIKRATSAALTCPKSVITYGLVGTELRMTRVDYASNCTTVTSSVTGKVMASNVANGATTKLFQFYDTTGAEITSTSSTAPYLTASAVKVNLWLKYKTVNSPVLKLNSSVALRNNR